MFLVLIFVRGWVDSRTIMRPGRIKSLKNPGNTYGNQTLDLPLCSAVSQPSVQLRVEMYSVPILNTAILKYIRTCLFWIRVIHRRCVSNNFTLRNVWTQLIGASLDLHCKGCYLNLKASTLDTLFSPDTFINSTWRWLWRQQHGERFWKVSFFFKFVYIDRGLPFPLLYIV